MKISTRAWHYRLLKKMDAPKPDNLCAYFWTVVAALAFCVFCVIISPILLVIFGLMEWAKWLERRKGERLARRGTLPPGVPYPREPSLLRAWLRAKKARVCPRLEFWE